MLDTEKVRWYSPHTLRKSVEQVRRRLSSVPLSVGGFGGGSAQRQMEQSENEIMYTINNQGLSVTELNKMVSKVKFMIPQSWYLW